MRSSVALVALGLLLAGCFGARPTLRSYYVLYGQPDSQSGGAAQPLTAETHVPALPPRDEPLFKGLLRVRNLNADDVYEKFQIVIRRNPYELRYSDLHVWAVKPDNMVSDIIARSLAEMGAFSSVTRELGDQRPEYTLGGELHAIEIYDSNDIWYAHLAMTLTLNKFSTGERMWKFDFDMRKQVPTTSFAHAVRALSEVLAAAMIESMKELEEVAEKRAAGVDIEHGPVEVVEPEKPREKPKEKPPEPVVTPEDEELLDPDHDPILVPEKPR